jgi:hypothetical protein
MSDSKDTIYIDVDEEITGIVSKVQNSPKDIVALVLPKRASVLQSIVNMKLLKRAQDQHDKKVVLITSETRILPLAGAAGLFVASNLTSKPYIPLSPKAVADKKPEDIDPNTPIEQVAPDAKFADASDEIEIDNTPKTPAPGAAKTAKDKPKSKSKLKVPNFSKFRKKIILIGLAVLLLIFALVYGIFIAPKAKVTVKAQTNELPLSLDFTADTNADSLDSENKTVRASSQEEQKNDSEKVDATGQTDKGNKASGTVTLQNCSASVNSVTIPAGTGVSSGSFTYITQSAVTLPPTQLNGLQQCTTPTKDVSVLAKEPGDKYNLSPRSYNVSGYSDVKAEGSQMTGGTSKIVKVVTQGDVDKAKERLNGKPNTVQEDFKNAFQRDGYIPVDESFKTTPGNYTVSPAVGAEGNQVTVSVTNTYSILGVKEDDLKQLIKDEVAKQNEGKNQTILSDGLSKAVFKISSGDGRLGDGQSTLSISTKVIIGPDVNQDNLKQQIAGKKSGEAENIIGQIPGLSDTKVELSPFWVGRVPKSHSKINIEIQQADGSKISEEEQIP